MSVQAKIVEMLQTAKIQFEELEHPPVFTSEQAAQIRDSDLSMGAKALVLVADKKPILCVVPGNQKADFKKVKTLVSAKDLRMATPEEVKKITTLEIGSIPPVGKVLGLSSYYDRGFLDKQQVVFNCGSHTHSVVMSAADLIRLEQPVLGDIVKL